MFPKDYFQSIPNVPSGTGLAVSLEIGYHDSLRTHPNYLSGLVWTSGFSKLPEVHTKPDK